MAYAKKTLLDLQQDIADKHDSGVLPTDSPTLAYWTRLLNNAQQYIADRLRLITSTDLTTVSGTIALPDDFVEIKDVVYENTYLSRISKEDSEGASGLVYWITGDQTNGFYLNTTDDQTYTVYYKFNPAPMVNNTDVCVIPDPLAVSVYAYAKLRQAETDPLEDANQSLGEAEARIAEMISVNKANEGSLSFSMMQNG